MVSIIFGTYRLNSEEKLKDMLRYVYLKGINKVDTAKMYRNEEIISDVCKEFNMNFEISTKISKYEGKM